MVRMIRLCVLGFLFWAQAPVATADPIVIWLNRAVQASASAAPPFVVQSKGRDGAETLSASAGVAAGGSQALSAAQLTSAFSLDNRYLSASSTTTAHAFTTPTPPDDRRIAQAGAFAEVFLRFTLLDPYRYDFDGLFTSSGPVEPGYPSAGSTWQAYLRSAPDPSLGFFYYQGDARGMLWETGLLLPGTYDLFVRGNAGARAVGDASVTAGGTYEFAFNLTRAEDVTVTPEPGSMLLLATGLAAIGRQIRRRRVAD